MICGEYIGGGAYITGGVYTGAGDVITGGVYAGVANPGSGMGSAWAAAPIRLDSNILLNIFHHELL